MFMANDLQSTFCKEIHKGKSGGDFQGLNTLLNCLGIQEMELPILL